MYVLVVATEILPLSFGNSNTQEWRQTLRLLAWMFTFFFKMIPGTWRGLAVIFTFDLSHILFHIDAFFMIVLSFISTDTEFLSGYSLS